MSALVSVRVLAASGSCLWCAVAGSLTRTTNTQLRDLLTATCAGATVVALDLRQLKPVGHETTLTMPLPDGPDIVHLLAPENLRLRQPATEDSRVRWHSELSTAWRAWSASCA
ncbi:hypothetical protein ACFUIY_01935 [Streptomyces griseorubiginosus]|uniref:hypothetical protein n=1 Tax=Streptomyces griseorubiginosus TaxID=67304 RepID=UPI00362BADDE